MWVGTRNRESLSAVGEDAETRSLEQLVQHPLHGREIGGLPSSRISLFPRLRT